MKRSLPHRIIHLLLGVAVAVIVTLMTGWATLAIYYSDLAGEPVRAALAGIFALGTVCSFLFLRNRRRTLIGFLIIFCAILAWWMSIPASNARDWQPDVAVLPYATINGDVVTIHKIRNLKYRTETDFEPRYYDKEFDLKKITSVDLVTVYWMGDAIAHVMVSFGFEGKDYVAFSIETRKEKSEAYSSIKGFFKQYELTYVVADERDVIRVRTDFRNPREDVYIFRTRMNRERARLLFMEYIKEINSLKERPEWYNTLTTNCTTNVVKHVKAFGGNVQYTWKILLSGYAAQYAYERGSLDTSLPFEELKKRGYVNPRAQAIGDDPDFSRRIREGLPIPR